MNIVELLEVINSYDYYEGSDKTMPEEAQVVLNAILEFDSENDYGEFEDIYSIGLNEFTYWFRDYSGNDDLELSIDGHPISLVDEYGGEGMGDDYWVVFECNGIYARVQGYYSSWEGGEYDEVVQVIPREEKVIRFYNV